MMKINSTMACLLALALAFASPALSQDENEGPTTREQVEEKLAELKTRLDLNDYQWEQVHLILKSGIRERVAIAQRYGLDGKGELEELSRKDKRQMRGALKDSREATEDRMKRYLTKDQMKEFKAIQKELHEELLARAEERANG